MWSSDLCDCLFFFRLPIVKLSEDACNSVNSRNAVLLVALCMCGDHVLAQNATGSNTFSASIRLSLLLRGPAVSVSMPPRQQPPMQVAKREMSAEKLKAERGPSPPPKKTRAPSPAASQASTRTAQKLSGFAASVAARQLKAQGASVKAERGQFNTPQKAPSMASSSTTRTPSSVPVKSARSQDNAWSTDCLLYTSPSPRDRG